VAPAGVGTPRRAVVGWDAARLAMVLAVLETRCGLVFANRDVYLNVAGGLRIAEPAADLAVAAALISSLGDRPVPVDCVVFGEIGLSGEVRAVSQTDARLKESSKLGFGGALTPVRRAGAGAANPARSGVKVTEIRDLSDLVAAIAPRDGVDPARRRQADFEAS
jgi:DNA repair protein RadA/Sms